MEKYLLKIGFLLMISLCVNSVFCQSPCPTPPPVNSPSCIVKYYNGGANCHGFVYRYLTGNYNIGSVQCPETDAAKINIIQTCVSEGSRNPTSLDPLLEEVSDKSASDVAVIIYEKMYQGNWVAVHSAVKIGGGSFLSKFEECGSVVRHYDTGINSDLYYQSDPAKFRIRYFRKKAVTPPPCTTPEITLAGCSSCSCATSQGYFLVSSSTQGSSYWTNPQWSISGYSGATIAWNLSGYIYVNSPNGGTANVTLQAYYTPCAVTKTKTQSFYFPSSSSCRSGGYYTYRMDSRTETFGEGKLILPENMIAFMGDSKTQNKKVNVKIYDLNGNLYLNEIIDATQSYLTLTSSLKKGIYVIKVVIDKDNIITEKIAVQD